MIKSWFYIRLQRFHIFHCFTKGPLVHTLLTYYGFWRRLPRKRNCAQFFWGHVIYRYIKSIHSENKASCKLLFKDTFSKGLILLLCNLAKNIVFIVCLFDGVKRHFSTILSWRSVLLVEETGGPGENHRPVASHWQTLSHNIVHFTLIEIRITLSVVICTDCIGSCKSGVYISNTAAGPRNKS